jgi:O-Antigen ligase/Tetratricopeptide repeat
MAGSVQTALPERALVGARAGARLAAVAPFLLGALLTGLLAGDHGGYWPTSWGWATLALVWAAALAIVLRDGLASRLELAWIGGLVALIGWTALSWFWTASRTQTALEVERTLVYVGTAVAAVAVVRSAGYRSLLWGVWAGATAASLYGLATRLLPERLGVTDVIAGYRLSSPVGYWNGLGLLTAVAATLALGLAALGRPAAGRAAASASLPLLLATLYFTFSRGAWIALAAALIAAVAISSRRLQLISALLVQAIPATAALVLAYGAKPLRRLDVPASQATHAGHTLAWKLMLVSLAASAITLAYARVAGRMRFPEAVRRAYAGLLAAAVLFGLGAVLVHYGGPAATLSHIKRSIDSSPPAQGSDLSTRLFTLSSGGRLRQWHVALDEWRAHPALGGGAGTYAEYWAAAGTNQGQLLDVHNLYLETLAELGPIGLALLVVTLLVPLVAAVRARDRTLTAIATGAYVAWLVHAGYDWDWELPGVTVAAILCAGAVLAAARGRGRTGPATWTRWTLLVVALGVGTAALLGLLGNRALARSSDALRKGNVAAAAAAAEDARHWAPWSAQPWKQLASVRIAQGDRAGALTAYRKAVAKDPRDWELWLGLTSVSRGAERARALARLAVLDPGAASSSSTGSP